MVIDNVPEVASFNIAEIAFFRMAILQPTIDL